MLKKSSLASSKASTKSQFISWKGLISYPESQKLQNNCLLSEDILTLLGCEHVECATLGYRYKIKDISHSVLNRLQSRDIPIYLSERGGKLTFHNPGQLVIYPVINLKSFGLSLKSYISLLLECSQELLAELGITTERDEKNSGLFVGKSKILSLGLRVQSGRSTHGLALNINNSLNLFLKLEPCGHKSLTMTSTKDCLGHSLLLEEVFYSWAQIFLKKLKNLS